jgi:parallel beta-helix repeat protein
MIQKSALTLIALLLGGILIIAAAARSQDQIWFEAIDKFDQAIWPYQQFLGKTRDHVDRIIDELNPMRNKQNILNELDVFHLTLSPQDVSTLLIKAKQNFETSNFEKPGNDFRKIETLYQGVRRKAQIKIHGDGEAHWLGKKKSFQLKLAKDDYVDGRRRMLFILPENREYLVPLFATEIAKRLKLPFIHNKMVAVTINGVLQGVYYWEEHINKKFLERKGLPDGVIVELSDNWIDDRLQARGDATQYYGGITYNDHHNTPFNLEISNLAKIDSEHAQLVYNKTKELLDAVRDRDMERFESLIDIDQVGAADAWRTVIGDRHSLVGDNVKMAYRLSFGKFVFIPRSEGDSRTLQYRGGSFVSHLNRKAGRIVRLFEMMARSEKIRRVRNRWLHELISREGELLAQHDQLVRKYLPLLQSDTTLPHTTHALSYLTRKQRSVIQSNIRRLRTQLEYAKVYVNMGVRRNYVDIDIIPDSSFQELLLDEFSLEFEGGEDTRKKINVTLQRFDDALEQYVTFRTHEGVWPFHLGTLWDGEQFGFSLDAELEPTPKHHRYRLIFDQTEPLVIQKAVLNFRESLTQKSVAHDDVYLSIADESNDMSDHRFQTAQEFMTRHPELDVNLEAGALVLQPGTYEIDDHVVVPRGTKLVISAGTELRIGPGKVFLSYSPVDFLGQETQPVVITAKNPTKPFGSFAVLGNRSDTVHARYLDVSYGSEAVLNGVHFLGALCFYQIHVEIEHVTIHDNQADDGMNVKDGNVRIRNSIFTNNFSDQVDLDFTTGYVLDSEFSVTPDRSNLNGDGLDLSGSQIVVHNSLFKNMSDKGISVGESSKTILSGNQIASNKIGVAVKDSSHALIHNNQFLGNNIAVSSYQKKQIFSGGHVYILVNKWEGNQRKTDFDHTSRTYAPTAEGSKYLSALQFGTDHIDYDDLFALQNWRSSQ